MKFTAVASVIAFAFVGIAAAATVEVAGPVAAREAMPEPASETPPDYIKRVSVLARPPSAYATAFRASFVEMRPSILTASTLMSTNATVVLVTPVITATGPPAPVAANSPANQEAIMMNNQFRSA
ncbi:hypothetical protein AX17_006234 [Amanita inopinata Kibby_2008]|nr:hypothetical protein AX17_006234 [Amanita inopinata Kibby_2008]